MSLPTNFFIGRGGAGLGPVQQYIIYMQGAGGGASFQNDNSAEIAHTSGGPGGFSSFSVYMPSNAKATIKVGGGGNAANISTAGGFPDGGNAIGYSTNTQVGTGGGSSSIRIPELDVIWYVGGGGGSGWGDIGGHGGGIDRNGSAGIDVHYVNGGSGTLIDSNWNAGNGGSTSAGGEAGGTYGGASPPGYSGSFNAGANVGSGHGGYPGGAGGGGWYGGGSGASNNGAGGGAGGGGSGYYTAGSLVTGLNYLIRSNPTVNIFGSSYSYASGISNYNTVFGNVPDRQAPFGSSNNPYDTGDYGYGGISNSGDEQGKPGQVVILNFTTNTVIFNQVGSHTSTLRLN